MSNAKVSVLSKISNIFRELQKAVPNVSFHQVKKVENDEELRKSHIIIADYNLIGPYLYSLPNVKWIQGTWAGIDVLIPHIRTSNPVAFPIVRFTGDHFGRLIGEYVVANIVNYERNMFEIRDNQKKQLWSKEGRISDYRSIYDLTVGILGLGNIGDRIARLLYYMGATVYGYGRGDTIDLTNNKHISRYFNSKNLTDFLQSVDYVISVLPNTKETRGLLDGNILENCKDRNTVFVNVGRGGIISEESLVTALREKWISGAILDVFDNEPLRQESPLWKLENVVITPHESGRSRAKDIAEQFAINLKLYEQNMPIPATIDFSKGY